MTRATRLSSTGLIFVLVKLVVLTLVYLWITKGRLRDGTFVAIKVLAVEIESMRGEREFISELAALSNIKHENLVKLRGCCVHGAERFLVYDHMENNSLFHTFLGKFKSSNTCFLIQKHDP